MRICSHKYQTCRYEAIQKAQEAGYTIHIADDARMVDNTNAIAK